MCKKHTWFNYICERRGGGTEACLETLVSTEYHITIKMFKMH